MAARPPQLDGDQIAAALKAGSRAPFQQILEIFLQAAPTAEEVAEFARRFPDRYAQGVTMLAKLSGFHEKMRVDHTHIVMELAELSDAELSERLQTTLEKLGIPVNAGDAIDLKALPERANGSEK